MKFDANLRPLRLADVSRSCAVRRWVYAYGVLSPHTIRFAACAGGSEHH